MQPSPHELSAGHNCSRQIGTKCEHNEWFTGRCWPQDSSSFTKEVHKCLVFLVLGSLCLCYCYLIYDNGLLVYYSDLTLTIYVRSYTLNILKLTQCPHNMRKKHQSVESKNQEEALKRNSHVILNRCLDSCCKHSTNHLPHPSLWSAAPLVCNQPASGCKFTSQILRISSGDVGVWMWRNLLGASRSLCVCPGGWSGRLKGQSSTAICKPQ